tara:strand:- start:1029 stop:1445 length:417 start_codon:yes stop_codon:yes gene_type:complete
MKSQRRIFDLLSKKQNLQLIKLTQKKNKLSAELKESIEQKLQLKSIIESSRNRGTELTAAAIQSESWYSIRIKDQLVALQNRIDFLSDEIKNQNVLVAMQKEKKNKYNEKKEYYHKMEKIEKENRFEASLQFKSLTKS